jgi:putative ABC transport system permease protein
MLKTYLRTAFRNLRKFRLFTIINITGLAVSVAFCLLLFLHIRHEQSYDSFHVNRDRLFRLEMTDIWKRKAEPEKKSIFSFLTETNDIKNGLVFPIVVADDLQRNFPELEYVVPVKDEGPSFVQVNNQNYKESHTVFAGEDFFRSLSFRLLKGDPATVFDDPKNIVLTDKLAKKYFGTDDPIGKIIMFTDRDSVLLKVAGVAEDAPENSGIQYDFVLSVRANPNYEQSLKEGFNWMNYVMLVQLKPNVNAAGFETKMNQWVKNYFTIPFFQKASWADQETVKKMHWYLRPITEAHYNISSPWAHYTNAKSLYQLACLVVIILVLASINYILLTVANGAARSKEVGVKKILGAKKGSVILQFWVETQLVVLLAVVVGAAIAWTVLPVYNRLTDSSISLAEFSVPEILGALLALSLLLGLLAGYYPALIISKMKPISLVRSGQTFKINPRFSKIMIVAQYTACIALMMGTWVINRQMKFISNKDLGFDKEQVLMVKNQGFDIDRTKKIRERFESWASSQPSIIHYSSMNGGLSGGGNTNGFKLNGQQYWLRQLSVDYDYFEMLDLKIVQGRSFSRQIAADTSSVIRPSIVNETLFKMLGDGAKLGVYNEDLRSTIIGVVKDYHFESLTKKIEPQQHVLGRRYAGYFLFKVRGGQMQSAVKNIGAQWQDVTAGLPFEYTFLDQDIARMYEADVRWQKLVQASCILAVIIACMGLFGLSAINASNRTKEIGIRKVLGADVKDIVSSLSLHFMGMIIISLLIAIPFAWWIMNAWLQDFEYRITITPWMFAGVALVAIAIALLTVSYQAIKAAIVNPINSLRSE